MEQWLNLILGGGLVATIGAVFKGLQMLRNSATARINNAVAKLEELAEESDERARVAWIEAQYRATLAYYWRTWAGTMEYLATRAGAEIPPRPPEPVPPQTPIPMVPVQEEKT